MTKEKIGNGIGICILPRQNLNNCQGIKQNEKIYLYKRIVKAKLFIDDYYADNIDLTNIAGQAHFSKFHFIRLFKSIYGKTPNNYLVKIRIDNAKILLAKGHSVLETSVKIGFDSPTSFTGIFKKVTGKTPSTFQREQALKRKAIQTNPLQFVPNCFAETHGWRNSNFEEVTSINNIHF
jgi:AraC-like DNA-binding protein